MRATQPANFSRQSRLIFIYIASRLKAEYSWSPLLGLANLLLTPLPRAGQIRITGLCYHLYLMICFDA